MKIAITAETVVLDVKVREVSQRNGRISVDAAHDHKDLLDSVTTEVYCEGVKVLHSSKASLADSYWYNTSFDDGTYGIGVHKSEVESAIQLVGFKNYVKTGALKEYLERVT